MRFLKIYLGIVVLAAFFVCLSDSIINQSIKPMGMLLLLVPSILSFWYSFKIMNPYAPSKNEKNLEKHKQEIENYGKFLAQVHLCASNNTAGNRINYVCIHKETKELFEFTAKMVGRQGVFDQYCFANQPQKIISYLQLLRCLSSNAKVYFSDLCENNWEYYFAFMLLPPGSQRRNIKKAIIIQ